MTTCVTCDPVAQAVGECTALLKAENLDAWLSLLLAPAPARPAMLSAWALLAETARLPWRLQEPLLCRLRMEFWRQALLGKAEEGQGGATGKDTPGTAEGASLALLHLWPPALPRQDMGEALANLSLLADGGFASMDEVLTWAEKTFMPLFRTLLTATTLSRDGLRITPPDMSALEGPLRALARGYGAGFLLRRAAWPRQTTATPLLVGELAGKEAARALADISRREHEKARRFPWPRPYLSALWPASLMQLWLRRAKSHPGFPFEPAPMPAQFIRQLLLIHHRLLGRL